MSATIADNKKEWVFPLSMNYATGIFFLVFVIPLGYTIFANLQSSSPPAVIIQAKAPIQPVITPQQQLANALKAVADNPGATTYVDLGMNYYNLAQYEDGIKAWQKALQYNPKNAVAYNDIAAAYGAMHKWNEEIDACQKALAINPGFDLAKRNLAWATSKRDEK